MDTFFSKIKKQKRAPWVGVLLFLICFVGVGLRLVHHSDWLIFQSDQSRDALIVERALNGSGISDLPLLGPQARGSSLHLGPVFYYFQYWSGSIFHYLPEAFAYPDLVFGILALPLLYLLSRMFFGEGLSIWLTALASGSLFFVTFSRFAWNPNSLPFFTLLFALFFLKALGSPPGKRYLKLGIAAMSLGIIAQLHFIAALGLLLALGVFLLWQRPLIRTEIFLCLGIIVMLYAPVLIHEYQSGAENTQAFLSSVMEKGSKDKHTLPEKAFRAYQEQSRVMWLILTGQQNTDLILTRGFSIKCDSECQEALPYSGMAFILLFVMIVMALSAIRSESNPVKRQSFTFLFLWFASFSLITVLVAYQISTRFYLGIVPSLFILLGLSVQRILRLGMNRLSRVVLIVVGCLAITLNYQATQLYLKGLSAARLSNEDFGPDLVFDTRNKVTLIQLRDIAQEAARRFDSRSPVLVSGESRYARSLYFVLSSDHARTGCYIKGSTDDVVVAIPEVMIRHTQDEAKEIPGFSMIPYGTLTAYFSELVQPEVNPEKSTLPKGCLDY